MQKQQCITNLLFNIFINHHDYTCQKEIDPNNPFDAIYGSRGLPAGSDSILVMFKKKFFIQE